MFILKILLPVMIIGSVYASSGSALYSKKCKSCHGKKAEKRAMGKAKVIKGLSVTTIEKDMYSYASGQRKSTSIVHKAKKDFIKKHNAKELRDLATYIHGL